MNEFRNDLKTAYDTLDMNNGNFKDLYERYDEASREVVDKHSPLVKRTVRSANAPWMDAEYCSNRAKRQKMEKLWKKNRTDKSRTSYIEQTRLICE